MGYSSEIAISWRLPSWTFVSYPCLRGTARSVIEVYLQRLSHRRVEHERHRLLIVSGNSQPIVSRAMRAPSMRARIDSQPGRVSSSSVPGASSQARASCTSSASRNSIATSAGTACLRRTSLRLLGERRTERGSTS
jgi:hypothetical protein